MDPCGFVAKYEIISNNSANHPRHTDCTMMCSCYYSMPGRTNLTIYEVFLMVNWTFSLVDNIVLSKKFYMYAKNMAAAHFKHWTLQRNVNFYI